MSCAVEPGSNEVIPSLSCGLSQWGRERERPRESGDSGRVPHDVANNVVLRSAYGPTLKCQLGVSLSGFEGLVRALASNVGFSGEGKHRHHLGFVPEASP